MNIARDAANASGVAVGPGVDVLVLVVFVVGVQPAADKTKSSNTERTSERTIISHLEQLIIARSRQYSMRLLILSLESLRFEDDLWRARVRTASGSDRKLLPFYEKKPLCFVPSRLTIYPVVTA